MTTIYVAKDSSWVDIRTKEKTLIGQVKNDWLCNLCKCNTINFGSIMFKINSPTKFKICCHQCVLEAPDIIEFIFDKGISDEIVKYIKDTVLP